MSAMPYKKRSKILKQKNTRAYRDYKTETPCSGGPFKGCQFLVSMVAHVPLKSRFCLLWRQGTLEVHSGGIRSPPLPKLPPHSYTNLRKSKCVSPENESLLPNFQTQNFVSINPLRQFHQITRQIIMVIFTFEIKRLLSRVVEKRRKIIMFQIILVRVTLVIVRNKTPNIHDLTQQGKKIWIFLVCIILYSTQSFRNPG